MQKPLVSIITPCYNGEKFIDRYFESILSQTYSNLELIFINDGSEDRTEEIALSYENALSAKGIIYIYIKQDNAGQAAALNRGLKLFSGKYLTWPDSDDVMTPDCIEKKVEFLEKNEQYGLAVCKINIINEENEKENRIGERKKPEGEDHFFEDLLFINNVFFVPGGYMVRSSSLLSIMPDREIYTGRGGQNSQIILPMVYHFKCGYMDDILYTYYIRKDSHSHSIDEAEKEIRQLYYYETILMETIKKIDQKVYNEYEMRIKQHYTRLRYGNAIDSQNIDLITDEYHALKKCGCVTIKEKIQYVKVKCKLFFLSLVKGRENNDV